MSEEKPLYKITQGKECITITTGYRGIEIEYDKTRVTVHGDFSFHTKGSP